MKIVLKWPANQKYSLFLFILIISLSLSNNLLSQHNNKTERWITGEIVSEPTGIPIPFSYIVNNRTGVGKETNGTGQFKMHIQPGDSIHFRCMGYVDTIWVASVSDLANDTLKLITKQKTYALNEVDVIWFRSYASFKYRVANLKVETDQPIKLNLNINFKELAALKKAESGSFGFSFSSGNGISISQKQYDDLRKKEQLLARYNQLTSRENLKDLTQLEGPKLDSFIVFLRSKHKINPNLPDYEILTHIQMVYENFLAMNTDSIP